MKLTPEDRARLDAVLRRVDENVRLAAAEDAESDARRAANRKDDRRQWWRPGAWYARPAVREGDGDE